MIDALLLPGQFKGMVLQLGPIAAHGLDLRPAGAGRIENAGFISQPLGRQNAGGGQNVGVVIALIALMTGASKMRETRNPQASGIDWPGTVTFTAMLALLTWALMAIPQYGVQSTQVVALLAGAAAYTRSVRIFGIGRGGKAREEQLEIRSLNNARAARARKGKAADLGFKPTGIVRVE